MTEEKFIQIVHALEANLNHEKSHDEVLSRQNFAYHVIPSSYYDNEGNGHHSISIDKSCIYFKDSPAVLRFSYEEFRRIVVTLHKFEIGHDAKVSIKATSDLTMSLIIPQILISFQ